jgi:hypothetical protein
VWSGVERRGTERLDSRSHNIPLFLPVAQCWHSGYDDDAEGSAATVSASERPKDAMAEEETRRKKEGCLRDCAESHVSTSCPRLAARRPYALPSSFVVATALNPSQCTTCTTAAMGGVGRYWRAPPPPPKHTHAHAQPNTTQLSLARSLARSGSHTRNSSPSPSIRNVASQSTERRHGKMHRELAQARDTACITAVLTTLESA